MKMKMITPTLAAAVGRGKHYLTRVPEHAGRAPSMPVIGSVKGKNLLGTGGASYFYCFGAT